MIESLADAQAFLERRIADRERKTRPSILDDPDVFPEERACALDGSPLKAVFCTRRAAKSFSFGLEAINDSYDWPGAKYLFLGMTREEARRIFWKDVLKAIDSKHGLGIRFNESTLTATMSNGAEIVIGAADANEQEMRKLLGQKYRRVCIDEAQDWTHTDLHDLVYSVLKPACADLGGSISMRGTPGKFLKGFFRQITPPSVQDGMRGVKGTFPGWALHSWDTLRNTAMMPAEPGGKPERMCDRWARQIAEMKAAHPGIEETPAFRRNYLGEWVLDESSLVYRYLAGRNDWNGVLPAYERGRWHHVIGLDLGYDDATAFFVAAYHDHDPNLYGREVMKEPGLDITAVAQRAKALQAKYGADVIVVDGANKQAVAEMTNRHSVSLLPADKTGKADFIELMNADFITGRVKLSAACAPLVDEYASLVWNDKSDKREEHPACENHAADAALYAWRHCYQYVARVQTPPPPPGTPEAYAAEAQRMLEAARRAVESEKREKAEAWGPEPSLGEALGGLSGMDWGIGE